jgi:predicted dehydrogenase
MRNVPDRYRTVLVGCGGRGRSHALGLLANSRRFELTAVCDQESSRAKALAEELSVPRIFTDADAMLASERADVLCFATQPAVRSRLVELGIRHGVRAIALEKPLALSLEEARAITSACDIAGVRAVVCHQLRHAEHFRRVKAIAADGGLGRIRLLHATARPSMLRVGTHLVDLMLWLAGASRATAVSGHADGVLAYAEDHPCPDHVAGIVELDSGARGVLEIGCRAPRHLTDEGFWGDVAVTLWGTHGHARVVLGGGWEAVTRDAARVRQSGPADSSPQEATHLALLADWLDDGRRVHPSNVTASLHGLEVLLGIAWSSLSRRRVALPLAGAPDGILERLRTDLIAAPTAT